MIEALNLQQVLDLAAQSNDELDKTIAQLDRTVKAVQQSMWTSEDVLYRSKMNNITNTLRDLSAIAIALRNYKVAK